MSSLLCQHCALQKTVYQATTVSNLKVHQRSKKCLRNQELNRSEPAQPTTAQIVMEEKKDILAKKIELLENKELLDLRFENEQLKLENEQLKAELHAIKNEQRTMLEMAVMPRVEEIGKKMMKTYKMSYTKGSKGTALFIYDCCSLNEDELPILYYDEK